MPVSPQLLYRDVMKFINSDGCSFLMKRLKAHEPFLYGHSVRVAVCSLAIAARLGIAEAERTSYLRSALLHDIGKLVVRSGTLRKKVPLSNEEWGELQQHPVRGAELLQSLIDGGRIMPEVILYHHENLDGSGYPFGKTERELSLAVRIVRAADSYDAMTCARGYNVRKSREEALAELYRWIDICYDAEVVETLQRLAAEARQRTESHRSD